MVSLTTLDPRWVTKGGRRVGVSFACPTCMETADPACSGRVAVFFDPPLDPGPAGPKPWRRTGDTFETLSLSPSILTRVAPNGAAHWHGYVTNGQVT